MIIPKAPRGQRSHHESSSPGQRFPAGHGSPEGDAPAGPIHLFYRLSCPRMMRRGRLPPPRSPLPFLSVTAPASKNCPAAPCAAGEKQLTTLPRTVSTAFSFFFRFFFRNSAFFSQGGKRNIIDNAVTRLCANGDRMVTSR